MRAPLPLPGLGLPSRGLAKKRNLHGVRVYNLGLGLGLGDGAGVAAGAGPPGAQRQEWPTADEAQVGLLLGGGGMGGEDVKGIR